MVKVVDKSTGPSKQTSSAQANDSTKSAGGHQMYIKSTTSGTHDVRRRLMSVLFLVIKWVTLNVKASFKCWVKSN